MSCGNVDLRLEKEAAKRAMRRNSQQNQCASMVEFSVRLGSINLFRHE